jgi:plastocyanin
MRIVILLTVLCLPLAACGRGSERRAESTPARGAAGSQAAPMNRTASAAQAAPAHATVEGNRAGRTVEVKMVEQSPTAMRFEPAEVTIHRGDVVRFVDTGVQPHNVAFVQGEVPAGANLGTAMTGPYVTQKGQTYEVRIDERFTPGRYEYICQPHQQFGMKGTIVVEP